MNLFKGLLYFFFLLIFSADPTDAQVIPPDRSGNNQSEIIRESEYSLLPVGGYSSDLGFFGGGVLQRVGYGNNVQPFLSNLVSDFTVSTKGNIMFDLFYEHTRTLGTDIRSLIEFTGQKIRQGYYFGIGNDTDFSDQLFDNKFYFFENREVAFFYQARKKVASFGEFGLIDLAGSVDVSYLNGLTRGEDSKFERDLPPGIGKSWSNKVGFGVIADSRDSEFSPTQGLRYQTSFEISSSMFGSDYSYSNLKVDLRHYVTVFDGVVLANKLHLESIQGKAPFWDLSIIGGNNGLRGFHLNRFRGNRSVLHLLELRSWLFTILDDQIRVGSQLFWDSGRVYSEFDTNSFFDDWKHSYGGGIIFTLFSPDLLVRSDIGFSNETFRIYFGAGYVF